MEDCEARMYYWLYLLLLGLILSTVFCYNSIPVNKAVTDCSIVEDVCLFDVSIVSQPCTIVSLGISLVYKQDEQVVYVQCNNMQKIPYFLVEDESSWRPAQKDENNIYILQLYNRNNSSNLHVQCKLV